MNSKPETRNLKNAYTNTPELHPNLILGSLQLFFWLFFHPSAWRNCVSRIDPTLHPDFALAELSSAQWRNPTLRRLMMMAYIVWPLLTGLLVGLVLWAVGKSGGGIAYGVAYGMAFSVVFNLAVGMAVGMAVGLAGGVVGGVASGVAGGVAFGVAGGVAFGVAGGVAFGVAGGWRRSAAVHVAFGVAVGVAFGTAFGVAFNLAVNLVFGAVIGVAGGVSYGVSYGVMFGVAVGIAVGWRTHRWHHGVAAGLVFGVALGVTIVVGDRLAGGVAGSAAVGAAQSAFFSALFAILYILAERIAGPWAGAAAGGLGGVVYFALENPLSPLPISILLGLTLAWWRPVLLYPFLAVWDILLYHADRRRSGSLPSLLRWHSAFWDEFQRLPLLGLDQHLILVAERNPVEGQAAIEYLATSHQRWAAQKARIELGVREPADCADVVG